MPGPSFQQSIHLSTAQGEYATVQVGQPLILHAQRSSGPWIKVKRDSLAPDSCWLTSPPADREAEVAGNLRWIVDPPGGATFNIDLRLDQTREVRFSVPGRYRLSAHSSVWCTESYAGNTLSVEVE